MGEDNRPRWSITWLLRIQRAGRVKQDGAPEARPETKARTWAFIIVGAVLVIEIGVWWTLSALGVL